jgi:preprotein translocase subunit YajC
MYRILLLMTALVTSFAAESGGPEAVPATTSGTGAPLPGGAHPQDGLFNPMTVLMFGGLGLFFWLFLIRPQKKEEKKRQELIASMKPGHKVITIGGIHGEVTAVGETTVEVRVNDERQGLVLTFNKSAIATNVTAIAANAPAPK